MTDSIKAAVERSVDVLGCEPLWLKEATPPEFQAVQQGEDGPPMILLHGLFGAMSNWDGTQPFMANYSKAINLSFPIISGHRSEVRVKSLAAYTEYYIRLNNLAPVVLCGNSLGGHVALRLCLTSPELVDCMILSGTSGLYEHTVDSLPVRPNEKFIREHMAKVFFNEEHITDEAVAEVLGILSDRKNHLNLIHAARSAKRDNLEKVLNQIKVPTLLLWGEDDEVTTMKVAKDFERLIPDSQLVTIKNCGHAPMIEYPEWFSNEVEKFLKTQSSFYKEKNGKK
ncbi:MAG: alpha/beta hydrolase [Bdellovibrionales bacterium]|nr:alpha/beta hydrolase [Bdellovibrionales bacterium]